MLKFCKVKCIKSLCIFNPLECRGNCSATSNNIMEDGTLAVDGWAVPNVTVHPSTASVPITVLLYNGALLCGYNVGIKALRDDQL